MGSLEAEGGKASRSEGDANILGESESMMKAQTGEIGWVVLLPVGMQAVRLMTRLWCGRLDIG
jgi:hypothetical protein